MRSHRSPMYPLLIASALVLALSGCAKTLTLQSPPAAELAVEAEPRLPPEAITSAAALDAFDNDYQAWGRRGWARVARLCVWFKDMGVQALDCEAR